MKIIKKISDLRLILEAARRRGKKIGFVPTMGFLHEGHLSLVRQAKEKNDIVVVSIFVNPIQFGPKEDFHQYPRDLKKDAHLLRNFCDILFIPSVDEMYPKGFSTHVEVQGLSDCLCGRPRTGHFNGVSTVVAKLFNIIGPHRAYFGQKDAQQAIIIKRMTRDLDFPVQIIVEPIVREKDGLAMSSRNVYLSQSERKDAVVLFQALKSAERMVQSGIKNPKKISVVLRDFIARTASARIDYIEIVDKMTLEPLNNIGKEALLLLAIYIGKTRLIDNIVLKVK